MGMLPLQPGIIYGPVHSRRLGRSLGINLLPTDYKLCSFDCIYCHYGRTRDKTLFPEGRVPGLRTGRGEAFPDTPTNNRNTLSVQGGALNKKTRGECLAPFPGAEQVLGAVREALQAHPDIDYLTFSGNGEATLHPQFPQIASGVRQLRDELRPDVKLTILSNSSTVHWPHIREALAGFEAPILKLDAGDPKTLAAINRPAPEVRLKDIIDGLKEVPGLIVQSVLVDGRVSNVRGAAFEAWLAALAQIRPSRVQIYSTDRPVPEVGVDKVPPPALRRLAGEIETRTGLPVDAYWA